MRKIYTVRDAMLLKALAEAEAVERGLKAAAEETALQALLRANPAIGVIIRKGKRMFYVIRNGQEIVSSDASALTGA